MRRLLCGGLLCGAADLGGALLLQPVAIPGRRIVARIRHDAAANRVLADVPGLVDERLIRTHDVIERLVAIDNLCSTLLG